MTFTDLGCAKSRLSLCMVMITDSLGLCKVRLMCPLELSPSVKRSSMSTTSSWPRYHTYSMCGRFESSPVMLHTKVRSLPGWTRRMSAVCRTARGNHLVSVYTYELTIWLGFLDIPYRFLTICLLNFILREYQYEISAFK